MDVPQPQARTLIGVIASHDSHTKTDSLIKIFNETTDEDLDRFHFVFTGGTYQRTLTDGFVGSDGSKTPRKLLPVDKGKHDLLRRISTRLPGYETGGVIILANLVVQRQCGILWDFHDPSKPHWLNQENLALMRLCDVWNVKRLMNQRSVRNWFSKESRHDEGRNRQSVPLKMRLATDEEGVEAAWEGMEQGYVFHRDKHSFSEYTVALIAHDEMKGRMVDFVTQYENELAGFHRILATGTTARQVEDASRRLKDHVTYCLSGPKGGDIEIATEILLGRCHVVIFFVDPLHPHPHIEDVRTVFGACMIQNEVQMLTNEVQAREWMECARLEGGLANMSIR